MPEFNPKWLTEAAKEIVEKLEYLPKIKFSVPRAVSEVVGTAKVAKVAVATPGVVLTAEEKAVQETLLGRIRKIGRQLGMDAGEEVAAAGIPEHIQARFNTGEKEIIALGQDGPIRYTNPAHMDYATNVDKSAGIAKKWTDTIKEQSAVSRIDPSTLRGGHK